MASQIQEEHFYLELSKNLIRFEPVSAVTNVFFDDCNRQVFAVRSGGVTGVVVKGPDEKKNLQFRMEDRGEVISIKFSYDMKILAIQRSHTSVEFVNFTEGMDSKEYSQSCRGKNTKIIAFNWTNLNEVVFVTDHGIELYQLLPEKKMLKLIKTHSLPVNWFVWLPENAVMLLSSGPLGTSIHPFQFRAGNVNKLPRFEIDLPPSTKPGMKQSLLERDVTMANIYGNLYVVVLRHQPRSSGGGSGAEIGMYLLPQKDGTAKKTDVLRLDMSGRFAINIVDNLVVVHHQASKTSMIFDIHLSGEEIDGIVHHHPVISPLPIKAFKLQLQSVPSTADTQVKEYDCDLYSPNWIAFQPNIIIDAKLGCLWTVHLILNPIISMLPDKCRLMDFLLQRKDSKAVILKVCTEMLTPNHQTDLLTIASIFDKLNKVYCDYLQAEVQALAIDSNTYKIDSIRRRQTIIDQSELYSNVLTIFLDNKEINHKFIVAVLVEYIRSLNQYDIPVQHYLYELVINTLVQNNSFYQLHQFLQYHVLSDSKPLACLMLSLEGVYTPAHQLALDMLKRLSTANEEIIEVLLSKQKLLTALRFVRSVGSSDTISARKFLEAASKTEDKHIFYTVFKFFEQRNIRLRNSPKFASGEHCEPYVEKFQNYFAAEALASS